MPAAELEKGFFRRSACSHVRPEHTLDYFRRILGLDVAIDLAAQRGFGTEPAAEINVIALDGVAFFRGLDLAGEKADFADVMLGARIMTAGEMDVDRAVKLHAALAPARDLLGMALGVGGGKFAADITGAGDKPGTDRVRTRGQTECCDRCFDGLDVFRGDP